METLFCTLTNDANLYQDVLEQRQAGSGLCIICYKLFNFNLCVAASCVSLNKSIQRRTRLIFVTILWLEVALQGEEEISKLAERMQNLLRPFVLRRLKTEVANQLAPKKHMLHKLAMTQEQERLYSKAVADLRKDLAPSTGKGIQAQRSDRWLLSGLYLLEHILC